MADRGRWARVEALFHAARERNADEQRAFLDAACVGDSDLRRDVETLLQQAADGSFLSEPALADTAAVIAGGAATNFRGRRLGVYEIQSLVGAGGMGEVYRARDTRLKRDVAVKILPTKFTSDRDRLARFEREARLLAALNHPHIASIYGVEESEGIRALVLELVDGETLADRLARGPLAAKEALHIARQLAEALDAAHEKGIVHRDLKPANVKITPSGSVKVLDFGLAKAIAGDGRQPHQSENPTDTFSGTHEGVILGTAAYMSPEQARGEAVDKRTDIWAFGCVMYEAVSGRRAFARATFSRTLDAVLHEEPDWDALPASTPRPLQRLIRRCLEKDAVRRQRDIGDARAELDDPIDANSSERSVRLRRWRWPAAAAAAVVVAGGAAVSFFSARDGRPVSAMTSRVIDQLTFDAGLTAMPALSPDGTLLAYASDRAGQGNLDIWVQQLPSGAPIQRTNDPTDDTTPSFSPDGRQIVFRSERDGGGLYVMPALAGDERPLGADGWVPRFSPDGKRLAYQFGSFRGLASDLGRQAFVLSLDGGAPRRLLADFASAREPTWSPDGRSILLVGRRDASSSLADAFDIWVVASDGSGQPSRTGMFDLVNLRTKVANLGVSTPVLGPWTPDGLLLSAPEGLLLLPLTASGHLNGSPRPITFGAGLYLHATSAADGQLVFALAQFPRVVQRAPLNNDGPATVIYTDAQTGPTRPSQTPDGASVIYEREFPGSTEIWIRTADGKPDRRLAAVPVTGVRAELQSVLSPDGTQIGYTIGQETDSPTGYVIGVRSGVPTRLCENCILFGFLSDSRRIIAIENRLRVRVIDTMSREGQDVLRSASGQVYRTHASPNDKWIAFQHNGKVWVTPLDPGRPPDESSWTAVDEPTKSGRPAGWATDSSVLYLILETDGFRCLYGQRIDPAGHLVDKPYAVRHFHNTGLQEYSTSFGNAITSDGFLYGGGVLKANLWRLRLSR